MKVLIGYDASHRAAVALDDLRRAGLPGDADLRIVTVWDTAWGPPLAMYEVLGLETDSAESSLGGMRALRGSTPSEARDTVATALGAMRLECLSWTLHSEAIVDRAAELARRADECGADLLLVGARAFTSGFEWWRLGSVATALAVNAPCPVEAVRPKVGNDQGAG